MTMQYWFGFRQNSPKPPGKAIACGPFTSRAKAMKDREASKGANDCAVSVPFMADSKGEAEEKAEKLT